MAASAQPSTTSGPSATSRSVRTSASTVPARSTRATLVWLAPTSTPTTTRARGFSASRDGGRPPVDTASP